MKLTTVKKLLTFTLAAGLLLSSATAFAAPQSEWPTTFPGNYTGKDGTQGGMASEYKGSDFYLHFYGSEPNSSAVSNADGYLWTARNGDEYKWDRANSKWMLISSSSGSFSSSSSSSSSSRSSHKKTAAEKEAEERKKAEEAAEREAQERAYQESLEQKREAEEGGFGDVEDMLDADNRDMSSAEWNNNAVLNTPGMDLSLPVSAGQGSVVIGGEKTNITPTIEKADTAFVDSINREKDGVLLNVLQVSYPSTDDAEITFNLPGLNAGNNIVAYQYINGVWTEVEVKEVRDGHVTLHMQGDGVVAFMLEPVKQAAAAQSGISDLMPDGKEMLEASEIISSVVIIEEQPIETPEGGSAEEPDKDKKDDKDDATEKQPVIKKIIHWNCYCGADFTDKEAFKQHALEGTRKGEIHSWHNWVEEVEVYK